MANQFSVEKNARGETDAAVRDHLSIPGEQPRWPTRRRAAITVLLALIPVSVILSSSREEQHHQHFQYKTWSRMPWGRACRHAAHFPSPNPFFFTFRNPGSFRMLVTLVTNFPPPLRTRASNIHLPGIVLHQTSNIYSLPSKHQGPGFLTLHGS